MTRIAKHVWIDAPASDVWRVLSDFGAVHRFNPNVARSYCTSESAGGLGATRHCELHVRGASIDERIVEWHEGLGYGVSMEGGAGTPPFKSARVQLAIREDAAGTVATGVLEYELKYGPIGALMDRSMVSARFDEAFGRILAGLKHHVETGEDVTEATDLPVDAVATGAELAPAAERAKVSRP